MTPFHGVNCDFGESFGIFRTGDDEGIAPYVQWANIACGFHGGDPLTMRRTVRLCMAHGHRIGAHPSLPDHTGFGRREMKIAPEDLRDNLIYQIGALKGFLDAEGGALNHVKLHGVIYSMSGRDEGLAEAVCDAVESFGVALVGIAGSKTEAAAIRRGIPFVREFYVDLGVDAEGKWIVEKRKPIDLDWLERRLRQALATGQIEAESGGHRYPALFESVGIHLDMPNAAEVAARVAQVLREHPAGGTPPG
ncbi:MAG: lactam utilization protein LamB [Paracoccus sp. BP8]|uniref:LamB/YcsF family protein n=1 Tax=Paracoccus pantotrophus TaxID=82367 RepID=UPI00049168D2|nr:LamB/YcsF family protein [Paracoccus pantotrophus]RQP05419.1 MAG: lactam utilization protein LamB [Paracoccus sp. BP8]